MKPDFMSNYRFMSIITAALLVFAVASGASGQDITASPSPDSSGPYYAATMTPDFQGIDESGVYETAPSEMTLSVGAGIAAVPDYEGSEDTQGVPLLLARLDCSSGRYLEFLGNRLSWNVLASDTYKLGPMLRYRSARDDDVDNDVVARLREVDDSVEAGAFLKIKMGNWNVNTNAAADVSDGHDGFLFRLGAGYTMPMDPWNLNFNIFTTYADDDYMESYFSIDADNSARSGLALYQADGGIKDIGAILTARYAPWEKWGLMGILGYLKLVGDAEDSPVVDVEGDDSQMFVGLMVTYRF